MHAWIRVRDDTLRCSPGLEILGPDTWVKLRPERTLQPLIRQNGVILSWHGWHRGTSGSGALQPCWEEGTLGQEGDSTPFLGSRKSALGLGPPSFPFPSCHGNLWARRTKSGR